MVLLRYLTLFSVWQRVEADIDNVFPTVYINNPVARHAAYPVPAGVPTVCTLAGHEDSSKALTFFIKTLPVRGKLYETSQNFRSYGIDPKSAPKPIEEHELPFVVTDAQYRVVYEPPQDAFPPEGYWASFTYVVKEPLSGVSSEDGYVVLNNPANRLASSGFVGGSDEWSIAGNIHSVTPSFEPVAWGSLDRYIYGTDEVQYTDFATGTDNTKWYFEAPPAKYLLPEMVGAYGGKIRFTTKSTYGDFNFLNQPLDWVTLECSSCNMGRGLRIVRFCDQLLSWDGSEKTVTIPIAANQSWRRDPLNTALPFTDATECEIAAVLAGVTKLKILGDFTQAGEGVALDDVVVESATQQPSYPTQCQQGCVCSSLRQSPFHSFGFHSTRKMKSMWTATN
jgi:hypothetical protein